MTILVYFAVNKFPARIKIPRKANLCVRYSSLSRGEIAERVEFAHNYRYFDAYFLTVLFFFLKDIRRVAYTVSPLHRALFPFFHISFSSCTVQQCSATVFSLDFQRNLLEQFRLISWKLQNYRASSTRNKRVLCNFYVFILSTNLEQDF